MCHTINILERKAIGISVTGQNYDKEVERAWLKAEVLEMDTVRNDGQMDVFVCASIVFVSIKYIN